MNNFYTTFNELYEQRACSKRYKYLAKKLGGIKKCGKDTPIKYSQILELNGLEDTLWALEEKNSDVTKRVLQLFHVGVAYNVLRFFEVKYPNDNCIRNVIKTRHLYAHGEASKEDLDNMVEHSLASGHKASEMAWRRAVDGDASWDAAWYVTKAAQDQENKRIVCLAAVTAAFLTVREGREIIRDNEKEFQTNLLMEILKDMEKV